MTTRPDLWNGGIGQRLVAAACDQFEAWGVRHAGLFTFAQSAKHVGLYGKFGFHPRFLTAIMAVPAGAQTMTSAALRYSALSEGQRQEAENACRELTEELYPSLDLRGEIRAVAARALGDTALLWDQDSRLAGFAVCHWGPASEAGEGCCFAKFGAVRPEPGAGERFGTLLDAWAALAREADMPNFLAGVNLARKKLVPFAPEYRIAAEQQKQSFLRRSWFRRGRPPGSRATLARGSPAFLI